LRRVIVPTGINQAPDVKQRKAALMRVWKWRFSVVIEAPDEFIERQRMDDAANIL